MNNAQRNAARHPKQDAAAKKRKQISNAFRTDHDDPQQAPSVRDRPRLRKLEVKLGSVLRREQAPEFDFGLWQQLLVS